MLVSPLDLALNILGTGCRWWRRICYFGDKISSRGFRNPVYQHSEQWNLHEYIKAQRKPKKYALTIVKELLLLV